MTVELCDSSPLGIHFSLFITQPHTSFILCYGISIYMGRRYPSHSVFLQASPFLVTAKSPTFCEIIQTICLSFCDPFLFFALQVFPLLSLCAHIPFLYLLFCFSFFFFHPDWLKIWSSMFADFRTAMYMLQCNQCYSQGQHFRVI